MSKEEEQHEALLQLLREVGDSCGMSEDGVLQLAERIEMIYGL